MNYRDQFWSQLFILLHFYVSRILSCLKEPLCYAMALQEVFCVAKELRNLAIAQFYT